MFKRTKFLIAVMMVSIAGSINPAICQPLSSGSDLTMRNPALMMGSDFLSLFQAYYKIGDWNMLLKLTYIASRKLYGEF